MIANEPAFVNAERPVCDVARYHRSRMGFRSAALLSFALIVAAAACVTSVDLEYADSTPTPGPQSCGADGARWRRTIVVDPALVAGTASLVAFPVPVALEAGLASTSNGGHVVNERDFVFLGEDGSQLVHEIERWN